MYIISIFTILFYLRTFERFDRYSSVRRTHPTNPFLYTDTKLINSILTNWTATTSHRLKSQIFEKAKIFKNGLLDIDWSDVYIVTEKNKRLFEEPSTIFFTIREKYSLFDQRKERKF